MITFLFHAAIVVIVLAALGFIWSVTWYWVVDKPDRDAKHASKTHVWFQPERLAHARHALRAALDVSAPADPRPSPRLALGAGAETRLHRAEIHHQAAIAWQDAENRRAGNWPMTSHGDYSDTGWTKRSATDLAIRLAEEALNTGFDAINPRGLVDYAFSGTTPRWEGSA